MFSNRDKPLIAAFIILLFLNFFITLIFMLQNKINAISPFIFDRTILFLNSFKFSTNTGASSAIWEEIPWHSSQTSFILGFASVIKSLVDKIHLSNWINFDSMLTVIMISATKTMAVKIVNIIFPFYILYYYMIIFYNVLKRNTLEGLFNI